MAINGLIKNGNNLIFASRPHNCTSFPDKRIRAIKARFGLRGGYRIAESEPRGYGVRCHKTLSQNTIKTLTQIKNTNTIT